MQEVKPGRKASLSEKVIAILVLAVSLGVLAFGGILAANYTSANWLQLLYMTSPLLVALLAKAVLDIPIPWALWPALALTLLGSGKLHYYTAFAVCLDQQCGRLCLASVWIGVSF
jgi:hypothetical protein